MRRSTLVTATLLALSPALHAQVWFPADGIWQIDGANGSGLTLDVRDNAVGIGLYTYDAEGNRAWYSGAGAIVDGVIETTLAAFGEMSADPLATLPITIGFDASAKGTLAIDNGQPLAIRHAAFGGSYIDGVVLNGAAGAVNTVPDMRGQWVFSGIGLEGGGSVDAKFIQATHDGNSVDFSTAPASRPLPQAGDVNLTCAPAPSGFATCALYVKRESSPPPAPLATFDPADLAATRVAGTKDGWVGFRVHDFMTPLQSGIWQIAGRPRQGFTVDVRENLVAIGMFGYDDAGKATWSLATGEIQGGTFVEADLVTFADGGCIGCAPTEPVVESTRPLRLEFVGSTRARLTIDGETVAASLLPYGADYLPKPLAGDALAVEFGPHALPALSGAWVQSGVYDALSDAGAPAVHPSVAFTYDDVETVSLGTDAYRLLLAEPDEDWGPPNTIGGSNASTLACEAVSEGDAATCRLIHPGGQGTPPSLPGNVATLTPWNIGPQRIDGLTFLGDFPRPVYLFRIPPRPEPAPAQ